MGEDNQESVAFQGEGQPNPQVVTPPAGDKPAAEPQYLTRADLDVFVAKLEDSLGRRIQSMSAKSESRIAKKVQASLVQLEQAAKDAGLQVTDGMRETMTAEVLRRALAEDDQPANADKKQADPQPVKKPDEARRTDADYVREAQERLFKKYGAFYTNDPGAEELKIITDPDEYIEKLTQLCKEKAARQNTPPNVKVPASLTGAVGDLKAAYENELANIHGDVDAIFALKGKYSKLGLKIS